jgi:hypothetical protein
MLGTSIITNEGLIILYSDGWWYNNTVRYFAINWNGDIITDHPLLSLFSEATFHQVRHAAYNIFWVEHNGQRGMINSLGEWIFVVE